MGTGSNAHGGLSDGFQGTRFLNVVAGAGRGLFAGAFAPANIGSIEFVKISTLGNTNDFGDLSVARGRGGVTTTNIRSHLAGGTSPDNGGNIIDYTTYNIPL